MMTDGSLAGFAARWIFHATVLLGVGLALGVLGRRAPAAVRCRLWGAVFFLLALAPLVAWLRPNLGFTLALSEPTATVERWLAPAELGRARLDEATPVPPAALAAPGRWALAILIVVWLLGTAALLARILAGHLVLRALLGRARSLSHESRWRALARAAGGAAPWRGALRLLMSSEAPVPLAARVRGPVVVLPVAARGWSDGAITAVLTHELAHLKRRDWGWQLFVRAVHALYWLHPLAWLAQKQHRLECERACDDVVLQSGVDRAEYAEHLLKISAEAAGRSEASEMVIALLGRSGLAARLDALLDSSRRHGPTPALWRSPSSWLSFTLLATSLCLTPFAARRPAAEQVGPDMYFASTSPTETGGLDRWMLAWCDGQSWVRVSGRYWPVLDGAGQLESLAADGSVEILELDHEGRRQFEASRAGIGEVQHSANGYDPSDPRVAAILILARARLGELGVGGESTHALGNVDGKSSVDRRDPAYVSAAERDMPAHIRAWQRKLDASLGPASTRDDLELLFADLDAEEEGCLLMAVATWTRGLKGAHARNVFESLTGLLADVGTPLWRTEALRILGGKALDEDELVRAYIRLLDDYPAKGERRQALVMLAGATAGDEQHLRRLLTVAEALTARERFFILAALAPECLQHDRFAPAYRAMLDS